MDKLAFNNNLYYRNLSQGLKYIGRFCLPCSVCAKNLKMIYLFIKDCIFKQWEQGHSFPYQYSTTSTYFKV